MMLLLMLVASSRSYFIASICTVFCIGMNILVQYNVDYHLVAEPKQLRSCLHWRYAHSALLLHRLGFLVGTLGLEGLDQTFRGIR